MPYYEHYKNTVFFNDLLKAQLINRVDTYFPEDEVGNFDDAFDLLLTKSNELVFTHVLSPFLRNLTMHQLRSSPLPRASAWRENFVPIDAADREDGDYGSTEEFLLAQSKNGVFCGETEAIVLAEALQLNFASTQVGDNMHQRAQTIHSYTQSDEAPSIHLFNYFHETKGHFFINEGEYYSTLSDGNCLFHGFSQHMRTTLIAEKRHSLSADKTEKQAENPTPITLQTMGLDTQENRKAINNHYNPAALLKSLRTLFNAGVSSQFSFKYLIDNQDEPISSLTNTLMALKPKENSLDRRPQDQQTETYDSDDMYASDSDDMYASDSDSDADADADAESSYSNVYLAMEEAHNLITLKTMGLDTQENRKAFDNHHDPEALLNSLQILFKAGISTQFSFKYLIDNQVEPLSNLTQTLMTLQPKESDLYIIPLSQQTKTSPRTAYMTMHKVNLLAENRKAIKSHRDPAALGEALEMLINPSMTSKEEAQCIFNYLMKHQAAPIQQLAKTLSVLTNSGINLSELLTLKSLPEGGRHGSIAKEPLLLEPIINLLIRPNLEPLLWEILCDLSSEFTSYRGTTTLIETLAARAPSDTEADILIAKMDSESSKKEAREFREVWKRIKTENDKKATPNTSKTAKRKWEKIKNLLLPLDDKGKVIHNSRKLLPQYWREGYSDGEFGSPLYNKYFKIWEKTTTSLAFPSWCNAIGLDSKDSVPYLSEKVRSHFLVNMESGHLQGHDSHLIDTKSCWAGGERHGLAICVMDMNEHLYCSEASSELKGVNSHHSSFLSGQPVLFAGELAVKEGRILEISMRSGHYQPQEANLLNFLTILKNNKVPLEGVSLRNARDEEIASDAQAYLALKESQKSPKLPQPAQEAQASNPSHSSFPQSRPTKAKVQCINFRSKRSESSWLISTVGPYPFYCSTGDNSGSKGTFFPFQGVLEKAIPTIQGKGWFIKPKFDITGNAILPADRFPEALIKHFESINLDGKENGDVLSERFFNIESMAISSLINTGFWTSDTGQSLSEHLKITYPCYMDKVYEDNKEAIDTLKSLSSEESIVPAIQEEAALNQFLAERLPGVFYQHEDDTGKMSFLNGTPQLQHHFKIEAQDMPVADSPSVEGTPMMKK